MQLCIDIDGIQSIVGPVRVTYFTPLNVAYLTLYLLLRVENATPPPNSNLTDGAQPLCYETGRQITNNFPQECQIFFNGSAQVAGSAVTTTAGQSSPDMCTLTSTESNSTFDHLV